MAKVHSRNSIATVLSAPKQWVLPFAAALSLLGCGSFQSVDAPRADAQPTQSTSQPPAPNSKHVSESTEILHVAILGDSQSTGGYGERLSELISYAAKQRLVYFGAASSARIGSWVSGGFSPIPANAFYGCYSGTDAHSCTPSMQAGRRTVTF